MGSSQEQLFVDCSDSKTKKKICKIQKRIKVFSSTKTFAKQQWNFENPFGKKYWIIVGKSRLPILITDGSM